MNRLVIFYIKRLAIVTLAVLSWHVSAAESAKVYSFAIVPQQAASELAESWSPVLSWLTAKTGIQLRFATAPSIPAFEQRLADGKYDFAYMNPYHYTVFSQKPGYQALAKEKNRRIQGILVVRTDSPIKELKDLEGETLVFPSPAAFAASILPRAELRKKGISFTPKYVSSHDSVYLNVAKGLYPAGGGITRTLTMATDVRDDLKILWTTEGYTPHAIAAHPSVPVEVRLTIQSAMLQMNEDNEGRKLLQAIGFKEGVTTATDTDWNDVRSLQIDLLTDYLK